MSQRIAHKIATAYAPLPEYDSSREIIPLLKERGELGFLLGDPVGRAGLISRYSAPTYSIAERRARRSRRSERSDSYRRIPQMARSATGQGDCRESWAEPIRFPRRKKAALDRDR